MRKTPGVRLLLAGFLLAIGSVSQAHAQGAKYSPEQMLDPRLAPKHDDVAISMPTPEELKSCTVESVQGSTAKSGGFVLLNAAKQPLRRFFDSKGGGKVDVWSYFKDGVEVYREFDTAGKGTPNNFRWLNAGGMKWGVGYVGANGKAVITSWRMISAEETAFEAFQAVAKSDFARLQALLINDNEMQLIKLPAARMKTIAGVQQSAPKKFSDFVQEANLAAVKFDGLESATPNCDTIIDDILIKYPSRAVRYVNAKKEHGWIHTGEMIQVGMAWRLVDVPTSKDPGTTNPGPGPMQPVAGNPQLEKLQNALAAHDTVGAKLPPAGIYDKNAAIDDHYRKRIELVQQIIKLEKADQQESWYKQLFDNYAALAQNSGDKAVVAMLHQLTDSVAKNMAGSNLAAYGTYRAMWTDYALELNKMPPPNQAEILKLQERWLGELTTFVKKYNKADDTPDALHQLAIGCEFNGKTEESKRWYKELYSNFPNHNLAPRARGSEARLDLVGKTMTLTAPLLADGSKTFNIAELKGKIVIVHYWASYSDQYKDDFARLARFMTQVGAKQKVELVCINLDDDATKAKAAVAAAQAPGIHLFQATNNAAGLSSPLATQYGIHILPTLFMVDRQGRVTSNSMQIGDIETELKKVQ